MRGLVPWRVWLCAAMAFVWLPTAGAQPAGLPPVWEVQANLAALAQQINGLKPLLDSVKPDQWTAQGAPEAYKAQWQVRLWTRSVTWAARPVNSRPIRNG